MYVQRFGSKLVKPLRIEKTGMEKRAAKTRQFSKTERNLLYWSWWPRLQRISQICEEKNWKDLWRCNEGNCIPEASQNDLWLCSGVSWIHKATSGIVSGDKTWRSHCRKRIYFDDTHYKLVHKLKPMPEAMQIPDTKAAVDKQRKKLKTMPAWQLDKSQDWGGGYSRSTKRQKESPLMPHWWTLVTSRTRS